MNHTIIQLKCFIYVKMFVETKIKILTLCYIRHGYIIKLEVSSQQLINSRYEFGIQHISILERQYKKKLKYCMQYSNLNVIIIMS